MEGRGPTWVATITTAGRAWLDSPAVATEMAPEGSDADHLTGQVIAAGGALDIPATDAEAKQ